MAVQHSRLVWPDQNAADFDQRPRLRLPLVPALLFTLAIANVASAVLVLVE